MSDFTRVMDFLFAGGWSRWVNDWISWIKNLLILITVVVLVIGLPAGFFAVRVATSLTGKLVVLVLALGLFTLAAFLLLTALKLTDEERKRLEEQTKCSNDLCSRGACSISSTKQKLKDLWDQMKAEKRPNTQTELLRQLQAFSTCANDITGTTAFPTIDLDNPPEVASVTDRASEAYEDFMRRNCTSCPDNWTSWVGSFLSIFGLLSLMILCFIVFSRFRNLGQQLLHLSLGPNATLWDSIQGYFQTYSVLLNEGSRWIFDVTLGIPFRILKPLFSRNRPTVGQYLTDLKDDVVKMFYDPTFASDIKERYPFFARAFARTSGAPAYNLRQADRPGNPRRPGPPGFVALDENVEPGYEEPTSAREFRQRRFESGIRIVT